MPGHPALANAEIDIASGASKVRDYLAAPFRLAELAFRLALLERTNLVPPSRPPPEFRPPVLVHALGTLSTASRAGELAVGGGACGVAELLRQLRPKLIVRARAVPR